MAKKRKKNRFVVKSSSSEELEPLTPSSEEPEPVTPSSEESEPVTPSSEESEPVTPSSEESEPVTPASEEPEPLTPASEEPEPLTPASEEPEPVTPSSEEPEPLTPSSEEPEPLTPSSEEPEPLTPSSEEPEPLTPSTEEAELEPFDASSPAISVIIPLYNAEEYLGECLDSILAQTFRNFEVIVVDDCSTDSSCAIVESYMEQFGGRLKLYHTPKNTGSGVVARNIGLSYARGEYVYNMDNDDVITKTALAELYTLAKEYDADVVHCERYYMSTGVGEDFIKNIHVATRKVQAPPYVKEPTLESPDLSERLQRILAAKFWAPPWQKLVRRDLLEKHKIFFPVVKISDDDIWTYALVFFAKKILRVPNMIYIRRMRDDSITAVKKTPQQLIHFWFNPILLGIKVLNNFLEQIEFFKANPQQQYAILELFFQGKLLKGFIEADELLPAEIYETIKDEFGQRLGEYDVLISALCAQIFAQHKTLKENQQNFNRAKNISQEIQNSIAAKDAEINRLKTSISYILEIRPSCPEISVIIPMYNAEKYIGECLDSLLAQTFPKFEVIVVDDCSTDDSVAVVNEYISKFSGRLKLTKTKKNSGSPAEPRNIGIALSRGEYLFMLNSDDTLTNDALEKIYNDAKKFNADVVTCEKFYSVPEERWNDSDFKRKLKPTNHDGINYVNKPTVVPFNITKRIQDCFDERFLWSIWNKLIRRDLMVENEIRFTNSPIQDMLVTCCLVYTAKKLVRVPYVINYYRMRKNSLHHQSQEPLQQFKTYLSALNVGFKYLDTFSSNLELFQQNHELKSRALKVYFREAWDKYIREVCDKISPQDREEILKEEFTDNNNALLMTFLLNGLFDMENENLIPSDFDPFITARVDIELKTKSPINDVQVLSVTSNRANILKPTLTNNSVIYQLLSHAGKMGIVAKAHMDGQIALKLRGLDVRDPKDKSKRIPYWIDYTKLTINEKTLFNKLTPIWHDKPYSYRREVKADEEIRIWTEWLPHRSDNIEEKIILPPPQIAPLELNVETARIDVKLLTKTPNSFHILSISADKASITRPKGLQGNGIGYMITSSTESLTFIAKASADGQFDLKLRGLDLRDPLNPSKRLQKWIDYTKLIVNSEIILDTLTPAWHDKPYLYKREAKAGDEFKVTIEWQPHKDKA